MIKLPQALLDENHRCITLDGVTIIESCFYEDKLEDTAFTTEHELIYIISGELMVEVEGTCILIQAGEAIFAKRGTYFYFQKLAKIIGQDYESVLFFIQRAFVFDFIQQYQLDFQYAPPPTKTLMKIPASPLLKGFIQSLLPYFDQDIAGIRDLLRLKTFELLFQIANVDPQLLNYFFHLNEIPQQDLVQLMEKNFTKNLPIKEFALLSGRSESTFKRDFKKVFAETPARWLRKKRLKLAQKLLKTTSQRPIDIYLQVGFEDYAHFSKAFKSEFGISPAHFKMNRSSM